MHHKRILLITSSYPTGTGDLREIAGIFVKDFAEELAKSAEVTVLTQQTEQGPAISCEGDVKVIRFPWRGKEVPLSNLRFPQDIFLILSVVFRGLLASYRTGRKGGIGYTLAFWAVPSGLWALSLKWMFGIKFAVWCLGSDVWDYKKNAVKKFLLRTILKNAHRLYADGYQLCSEVGVICGKKCEFLPLARRWPKYVTVKPEIAQGKKNFLFIGRYHLNKGPDVLLRAVAALEPAIKTKVHFHFFGDGPLHAKLKEFIINNDLSNIVSLNGYIDQEYAAAYLEACDALIIPSRIESIPVVLSDALQKGSAVMVTDVGDMGYLVNKYQAGIVVQPESPEVMADAIKGLVLENGDRFAEGRANLLELFKLRSIVETFIAA